MTFTEYTASLERWLRDFPDFESAPQRKPRCPARRAAHLAEAAAKLGCSIKTLNGHVAAARSAMSSSATAPSARARCSPTPISTHSSPRKPERIHHVPLPQPALAVLALRFQVARSSISRVHESHQPARSEKVETAEREKAKERSRNSRRPRPRCGSKTWRRAIGRRSASTTPAPPNTWHQLGLLIKFLGGECSLLDIDDSKVAALVAWRRGHPGKRGLALALRRQRHHRATQEAVHPREAVGRAFRARAEMAQHWLKEPQERVRELVGDEARAARGGDPRRLPAVLPLRAGDRAAAARNACCGGARSIGTLAKSASSARAAGW